MDVKPNKIPIGLSLDTLAINQPEGLSRFILNGVIDKDGSSTDELGTTLCQSSLGDIVGSIQIDTNEFILFFKPGLLLQFNSLTNTKTVLVSDPLFKFNLPIKGQYSLIKGCERIIYWQDCENVNRHFNLDRPELYKDDLGNWLTDRFSYHRQVTHPVIKTSVENYRGQLEYGTYHFVVQSYDESENILFRSLADINYTIIDNTRLEGALNLATNSEDVGGQPISNKAIRLNITNLTGEFARIIAFKTITSDGRTVETQELSNFIPIDNGSIDFLYSGFNEFIPAVSSSYTVPLTVYKAGGDFAQASNRLLQGNVKEDIPDYSLCQKSASKICTNYTTKSLAKNNINFRLLNESFRGGDVVAPAIVYVRANGTTTPPCHIPGRAKIASDSSTIQTVGSTEIVSNYNITNLDLEVFGIDGTGSSLRFDYTFTNPISNLSFLYQKDDGSQFVINGAGQSGFGLVFFTGADQAGIIGDNSKLLIQSNGITIEEINIDWINKPNYSGEINTFNTRDIEVWELLDTSITSTKELGYYESNQLYENPSCLTDFWGQDCKGFDLLGSNIRYHVIPDRTKIPLMDSSNVNLIGLEFSNIEYPSDDIVGHYFVIDLIQKTRVNAKGIGFNFGCDAAEQLCDNGEYFTQNLNINNSYYNLFSGEYNIRQNLVTGQFLIEEGQFDYNSGSSSRDYNGIFDDSLPYSDLELTRNLYEATGYSFTTNIYSEILDSKIIQSRSKYENLENLSYTNGFNVINTINPLNINNRIKYASVRSVTNQFPDLYAIRYRRLTDINSNVSFKGGYFVSQVDYTNISKLNTGDRNFFQTITFQDTTIKADFEVFEDFYIESDVNFNLRHQGSDLCNKFYNKSQDAFEFIRIKLTEDYLEKSIVRKSICQFWSGYNKDYSRLNDYNQFYPLSKSYNYCSDCEGEFPHRIIYSDKRFDNDLADNYRFFKANNFVDIPSSKGKIIAIDEKDNRLIVRTERAMFTLVFNNQQLQLTETTVNIGTGDFLSIPAKEFNPTDIGFAGQKHPFESVNTEHGLVWIDRERGKIHLLGNNYDQISRYGLYDWFFDNLNNDNHCILTYNPALETLIITLTNSWTISYSFKNKVWLSWHSYIPDFYIYDNRTFFSFYNQSLYSHNTGLPDTYYGLIFEYILEYTVKDFHNFNPVSIWFYAKGFINDVWNPDLVFNQCIIYSDNQSTGIRNIVNNEYNIYHNNDEINIKRTDENWRISPILDLSNTNDIHTTNIFSIKQGLNLSQGYLDKLPNNIDYNKPQVEQAYINSKYINVRLIKNDNDYRLHTSIILTNKLNSFR